MTDFSSENATAGFSLRRPESAREYGLKTSTAKVRNLKVAATENNGGLAAFTPDWKDQIHRMRTRIEKERTPRGQDDLAIKTGKGGFMDAEFIAQAMCLEHGWQEANTLRALERGRDAVGVQSSDGVSAKGTLKRELQPLTRADWDKLIGNYRRLRRVEGILRRWSYEGETVLPDDAPAYYRVSVRCGFAIPDEFRKALANWRGAIREVYNKMFHARTERRKEK